ncbi:DUF192 domain-containing protein [Massilia sp. W12]|uniref:DUF192 domain-containing protein n=1 Tax=Massilia sp. W12 TaxID=3126507 RepID=UPI0030D41CBB
MKSAHLLLPAALLCLSLPCSAQVKFPVTQLNIGMYVIKAELAAAPEERAQGLMYRRKMAHNEGMVFDFGAPAQVCMWMKNTYIPLSVAFIDEERRIINIEDMQPLSEESHCGTRPVRYALEMNQGWFKQKNIKPGAQIDGLPK